MSKYHTFEKTYCINLDRRPDRWKKIQESSEAVGVDLFRVPAIDGADLDVPTYVTPYLKGQLGCLLSHKNVLQDMLDNDFERIIVFEDDAEFHPQFTSKFNEFFEQLPSDWGFCYLGGSNMKPPTPVSKNVGKTIETLSTVGYFLNRLFAKNVLLPALSDFDLGNKTKSGKTHYEVDLNFSSLQKDHDMYIFNPRLVYQYESFSDIQMINVFYQHAVDFSTTHSEESHDI